jgi:hypothetical protein
MWKLPGTHGSSSLSIHGKDELAQTVVCLSLVDDEEAIAKMIVIIPQMNRFDAAAYITTLSRCSKRQMSRGRTIRSL